MRFILLLAALAILPLPAHAHPTQFTTLQVKIEPDGSYHATLNIDILSYALGKASADTSNEELQAALDAPRATLAQELADAGDRFRREVVFHTDASDPPPSSWQLPGLPEVNAVLARKIKPPILMPGDIAFSGKLPASAHTLSVRLPFVLGDTLHLYELPDGGSDEQPVAAGEYSTPVKLPPRPSPPASSAKRAILPGIVVIALLVAASYRIRKARHPHEK